MKNCSRCHELKPLSQYRKRTRARDGHTYACKACLAVEDKGRDKDKVRVKNAIGYAQNREREKARVQAYRAANPDKVRRAYAEWVQSNRDKKNSTVQAYRFRRVGQLVEQVDHAIVFERDGWICQLCFEPVDKHLVGREPMAKSLDHILPLSKGGLHSYANVQLAHFGCNAAKNASILEGV